MSRKIGESSGWQSNWANQPRGINRLIVVNDDVGEGDIASVGKRPGNEDISSKRYGIRHAQFSQCETGAKHVRTSGTAGTVGGKIEPVRPAYKNGVERWEAWIAGVRSRVSCHLARR